jgi:hypothetical protein
MVDLIYLPPQEAPKQLTARQGTQHLHEHFLGFLNANNCTGFTAEEVSSIGEDAIIELLLWIGRSPQVSERRFKRYATQIKRTTNGNISHSRALELVARALGYANWYEVKQLQKGTQRIISNRSNPDRLHLRLFKP